MQAALSSETILECLHNDLQDAARSLCPQIDESLEAVLAAGADHALVSGSGPTVLGIFVEAGHAERASRVCESLAEGRTPAPVLARPAGRFM
jgi:4-diphosphocytidyl-2-C-methyl-D-erythritol kinase